MNRIKAPLSPKVFFGGVVTGVIVTPLLALLAQLASPIRVEAEDPKSSSDPALIARVETIEGKLPNQSHAMMDVSYHFSNLWFAANEENWPLAGFYLNETKSHLRWAVRIIPIRKDPEGKEVDLGGILEAVENTHFAWLEEALAKKEKARFEEVYRLTLEACYACHKASGKPYHQAQDARGPSRNDDRVRTGGRLAPLRKGCPPP